MNKDTKGKMARKTEPVRTCLGCRLKRGQREMIRIVRRPDSELCFDLEGRLPGRGTYVCPSPSCLRALRRSSLARELNGEVTLPDYPTLHRTLGRRLETKSRNLLTIGKKSHRVVSGTRSVKDAVLKRKVKLLIFATDVPREKEEFFRKLETQVPTRTLADQETLGHWLGRDSLAVAAICSQGLATALMRELDRLTSLSFSSYHGN